MPKSTKLATANDWKRVIWSKPCEANCRELWRKRHGMGLRGPLQNIDSIMKKENFARILRTHLPDFVDTDYFFPQKE